jgi:hypothetical protein
VKRAAFFAVAAAVALVLLVVHDDGKGSAQAAVSRAAARTVDAGSSRFTISVNVPQLLVQLAPGYEVEGLMDYVHHRGRISYWRDSELLLDGDVAYVKWPMPWRQDTPWLRYETDSSDADPLSLEARAMRNPNSLLDFLTGASSDVRDAGSEDVRGRPTTHYEGTLDLQKVVDEAPPDKRAELQDWLNFIAEDEATKVPFGLWVDNDGVARRLRIDEQGGASMTIEYYDFGVPVEITPPPASEIISDEEFAKEIEQHAGDSTCSGADVGSGDTSARGSNADTGSSADTSNWYSSGSSGDVGSGSSAGNGGIEICIESTADDG